MYYPLNILAVGRATKQLIYPASCSTYPSPYLMQPNKHLQVDITSIFYEGLFIYFTVLCFPELLCFQNLPLPTGGSPVTL